MWGREARAGRTTDFMPSLSSWEHMVGHLCWSRWAFEFIQQSSSYVLIDSTGKEGGDVQLSLRETCLLRMHIYSQHWYFSSFQMFIEGQTNTLGGGASQPTCFHPMHVWLLGMKRGECILLSVHDPTSWVVKAAGVEHYPRLRSTPCGTGIATGALSVTISQEFTRPS